MGKTVPAEAAAKSWYHSEEYQRLAQHRFASADTNLVLIKGVDSRLRQ